MDGRRDYLIEVIERAGSALAAMVTGRSALDEIDEDEGDVDASFEREFGELHEHLTRLDSSSAALLLRPPRRVRLYALMLVQRAGRAGEDTEALSRRALELLLAADSLDGEQAEAGLLGALLAAVEPARLEPEARAALMARGLL